MANYHQMRRECRPLPAAVLYSSCGRQVNLFFRVDRQPLSERDEPRARSQESSRSGIIRQLSQSDLKCCVASRDTSGLRCPANSGLIQSPAHGPITSRQCWYEGLRFSSRRQTFAGSWCCPPLVASNVGKRRTTR
jgi:hypothetical protein